MNNLKHLSILGLVVVLGCSGGSEAISSTAHSFQSLEVSDLATELKGALEIPPQMVLESQATDQLFLASELSDRPISTLEADLKVNYGGLIGSLEESGVLIRYCEDSASALCDSSYQLIFWDPALKGIRVKLSGANPSKLRGFFELIPLARLPKHFDSSASSVGTGSGSGESLVTTIATSVATGSESLEGLVVGKPLRIQVEILLP